MQQYENIESASCSDEINKIDTFFPSHAVCLFICTHWEWWTGSGLSAEKISGNSPRHNSIIHLYFPCSTCKNTAFPDVVQSLLCYLSNKRFLFFMSNSHSSKRSTNKQRQMEMFELLTHLLHTVFMLRNISYRANLLDHACSQEINLVCFYTSTCALL